ncbi:GFA family protein [Lysobacter sp. TY2-98]|uniref:GFA family protein n=1 Tax=Lysobacter sp. TY2-98 TaxID=2290922 RepID=UPI000E20997E|nr:GFA family protein [Lysobacter sp. TY2-98]AXK72127.1 GFA family protein [Lysobacter sp. TY2-98]
MTGWTGSCHCGAIEFAIDGPIDELTTCDCTLCAMRGALMTKVPERALRVLRGRDHLVLYQWNTRVARHFFCAACGVYVFHRKRAAPDHFGVNVRCLRDFDVAAYPMRATDGASMSVVGPREECA